MFPNRMIFSLYSETVDFIFPEQHAERVVNQHRGSPAARHGTGPKATGTYRAVVLAQILTLDGDEIEIDRRPRQSSNSNSQTRND